MIFSHATLAERIEHLYADLLAAMDAAHSAAQDRQDADELLVDARARILGTHDPKDLGGNETARAARVNELVAGELKNQRDAAQTERAKLHSLRIAEKKVEEVRLHVRMAELAAGVSLAERNLDR
jgi:hypothetical protein